MTDTSDIDALFTLPLADFTAARNALASRLKKEGRAVEAARVKALPKPPATAWAVNQIFWRHRKEMDRLLALGDKVRAAQRKSAGDLRDLLAERRRMVSELTGRAAEILEGAGSAASMDAKRRIATNLESLATWGSSSSEVQPGRLTSDLEPLGFDGLAALLGGKKLDAPKVLQFRRAAEQKKTAEDAAAARTQAKEAIKAAEKALTGARRDAERAEGAAAKARKRAEDLEEQKREIDELHEKAQKEARAAASEAKKAAQAVADAERALAHARAALE